MALAALVPLLGSLAGGTAASAGLLGAGMSGITGALTASALGSGLGTLAVTGDPMKALESGALGFLTGGALGGFGSGIGNAAVEAEKAAAAAAAGGAGAGAVGGDLASAGVDAAKNAIVGGTAQDVAQTAATAGADALGNATGTMVGSLAPNSIVQTGAPALATAPGMGIGQAFKDTLGGVGGMKGLMKAGEIALPGIGMSQPELAPYVAPVYTSPGLTPYKQRVAGGYTPGYRPGYDPEQLYFKPAATLANGGPVPGYADGNVVKLADGTRNEPTPAVNNLGQQPNQLGRRYDQDKYSVFGDSGETRSFGNNMKPQNQYAPLQNMSQGQPMGPGGKGGPTGVPISQSVSVNPSMQSGQPAGPGGKGNGTPMYQNGPGMPSNQQGGPSGKGNGSPLQNMQNMPQGMMQGLQNMPPHQLQQLMQQFGGQDQRGPRGPNGHHGPHDNYGMQNPQQMNGMPQQDFATQQAFSQQQAQNLMGQMQNGGQNTLNASMVPMVSRPSSSQAYVGQAALSNSGPANTATTQSQYQAQVQGATPGAGGQQVGMQVMAPPPERPAPSSTGANLPGIAVAQQSINNSLPQFGTTPQPGFADGGQVPYTGMSARAGLHIPGINQVGYGPASAMMQYNGGYDRGPFSGGMPNFAHGGGMKGNGMMAPFGGSPSDNRPGLHMAFANGGGIPAMSAMGMMGGMPGMPGGDMSVPPIAGDGSSDSIPATIDGRAPALLSADEHVIPSDVVAHLGNGSSAVGHKKLRNMVKKVRVQKTGKAGLPKRINPERMMPA